MRTGVGRQRFRFLKFQPNIPGFLKLAIHCARRSFCTLSRFSKASFCVLLLCLLDMLVLRGLLNWSRLPQLLRSMAACCICGNSKERDSKVPHAFVPLKFDLGEAFQFDWSEEGLVVGGIYYRMQVSHLKLCASRAFWLVAYPSQGHEMQFDAHTRSFPHWAASPVVASTTT
jgi:hypothetical protein